MNLLLRKVKIVLSLLLFVFVSCKNDDIQQLEEKDFVNFTPRLGDTLVTATGFECGTAKLWDEMFAVLEMPKNYKNLSFITTKKKFYSFLSVAESNSFVFNAFDAKQFKEFYIPTEHDSMWPTLPVANPCVIKVNLTDSFPAKISYNVDANKQLRVCIETDPTIVNQLLKILIENKLGKLPQRI